MNVTRIPHLDGDPGVAQTIRAMRSLIRQGKQDPAVHELAAQILTKARVPAFDWTGEARAVYDSVRKNLRFTRDPYGNETLTAAPDIIRLKIGDCDDFTVLICSLLQTIGQECRIVTIATEAPYLGSSRSFPSGGPELPEFIHVYPEALLDGRWVALDAARKHPAFGKSPEHFTRKRAWSIDSEEYTDMAGFVTSIAPRGQGPAGAWRANVFPPFRRGMTGKYLAGFPVPPASQRFQKPPEGFGTYGRRAGARMGIGFDAGDLTNVITAGTTGAANIVAAERASPYNLFPTTQYGRQSGSSSLFPQQMFPTSSSFGGIGTGTLLLGGGLLIAAIALSRR